MTSDQQLGPNWRPAQLTHWRTRGEQVLGPTATRILLHILDGETTIHGLSDRMGLSTSSIGSHVRRLTGMGLVSWTFKRGAPILPTCEYVVWWVVL